MNGRAFPDNSTIYDSEEILRTVEGIGLANMFTKLKCSSFYNDYFENNFYLWTICLVIALSNTKKSNKLKEVSEAAFYSFY